MSPNRKTGPHALVAFCIAALAPVVMAQPAAPAVDGALAADLRRLAEQAAVPSGGTPVRVQVEVGELDPRLKLAPCARIEPRIPAGTRLWGRTRVGLRCVDGPTRWQVYLPVTVKVHGRSIVAAAPMRAGTTLSAADLRVAETDLAAEPGTAIADASKLVGRTLARDLKPGQAVRDLHLKPRHWFAAGDPVRIVAAGRGWHVNAAAVALGAGIDGAAVRARTESGRIVSGRAVAPRLIELAL